MTTMMMFTDSKFLGFWLFWLVSRWKTSDWTSGEIQQCDSGTAQFVNGGNNNFYTDNYDKRMIAYDFYQDVG